MIQANSLLRKPGFTLIETLIAFLIMAIVLGASLVGSRALSQQARVTNDQAQMGALADESIAALRLLRDASPATSLGQILGIEASNKVTGVIVGIPIPSQTVPWEGGAIGMKWIKRDPANITYTGHISPIGVTGTTTCGNPTTGIDCTLGSLESVIGGAGELIALRKADYTSSFSHPSGSKNGVISLGNPWENPVKTRLYTNQTDQWNFYLRTIQVDKIGDVYTVKVVVKNFYDKQSMLDRTVQLTDYYN